MNLDMKCYVKLNDEWRSEIKAKLICFVPRLSVLIKERFYCDKFPQSTTNDAIVILETYDKGGIYQLPLHLIKIVDDWDEDE